MTSRNAKQNAARDSAQASLPPVSRRVVIEGVSPEIDGGRFPIKRVVGERVVVEADIFTDGHDAIGCVLKYRRLEDSRWAEVPMEPLPNDRWRGEFTVREPGRYLYTFEAWVDRFRTWHRDLRKRLAAGAVSPVDLQIGAELVQDAAKRPAREDSAQLARWASRLGSGKLSEADVVDLERVLVPLVERSSERARPTTYPRELSVVVDRERARFSSWYEMFPRSTSPDPGRHGTFRDCEERLPYVAEMGFDVVYLPPVHPIGVTHRKGKNNTLAAGPGDVGSPWAIGSLEGGHTSIHPDLGTLDDFRRLVSRAGELGLEVAIDIAFQCSPDHPYVREHPEWFRKRPDGTIQYAENPPKKYQDIYPFDFDTEAWESLWLELLRVARFWIEQGVRIFRVDNPHTKPLRFWEWWIAEVKRECPEALFLSEAFTRPKVMRNLAKRGFTQSYTYFTWRNTSRELRNYFEELTQTEMREYFRPNLWPNTPDILAEYLQFGGRPAFRTRVALAATLGASYGIYGPAFELGENRPREPRSEEYLHSEKYEVRHWNLDAPESTSELIARLNRIRRENPALQADRGLRFHSTSNDELLCYSKSTDDLSNIVLVVVNLSPHYRHSGWIDLDLGALELDPDVQFQVHDLLSDARYLWRGPRNYVELDPQVTPAHVFVIRRHVRKEHDFDYFM